MPAFSSYAVADVVGSRVWVSDEYVEYVMSGAAIDRFQYCQNGEFFGMDSPIPLSKLVEQEIYPVCREARAAALTEAYRDSDGCLVLKQNLQGLQIGVVFHPSTTLPGHIQASSFNQFGFVRSTTHETLTMAVCEYADFQSDGKTFIEGVFGKRSVQ